MSKLEPVEIRDVSEGIIQKVDEGIVPRNSVKLSVNMDYDNVLGRGVLRPGMTQLGGQIADGKACLGLHQHLTTAGGNVPLALFNAADDATAVLSKYATGSWSNAKTGLTQGVKMRFETFLDTTVGINGADKITSADGSSWATSGGNLDVGNITSGATLIREFKDRVYTNGGVGDRDRLIRSSTPTAGAISWTVGNDYVDVEPEDGGGGLTALAKTPGYLLAFKKRSLKRFDGSSTYPESLMNLGTPSQEAVVMTKQSTYFFNEVGVLVTEGEYPVRISRRIQAIIEAIPGAYLDQVSGWGDGLAVYFAIGDITLYGLQLSNCVIRYVIDSQHWSLRSYPNEFRAWHRYVDSNGAEEVIAGDDDGNVWRLSGIDDAGSLIPWRMRWQTQEFGNRGRFKDIATTVAYTRNVRNGALSARINEEGDFKPIGNITKAVEEIQHDMHGQFFEFDMTGTGRGDVHVIGLEFPDLDANLNFSR